MSKFISGATMASSTLDSTAAFEDRAKAFGVESWLLDKLQAQHLNTFGSFAFSIAHNPQVQNDKPFVDFMQALAETELEPIQLAVLRRLFFESHTLALADVRMRVESSPDPTAASRKLPAAERLARQEAQQKRLGGVIFNPDTIPSNHLVDTFVEMLEHSRLQYVKPEQCTSRAQEISAVKKDPTIATDSQGMLKLSTKSSDVFCEANSELKLRAAFQRRSLAMDLSGIASYDVVEPWVQFLFSQLLREQPRGFAKITLQQLIDCDKQLFIMASHQTLGKLQGTPGGDKPLDEAIKTLKLSHEILQYLSPLPTVKHHDLPVPDVVRPTKVQKVGDVKGEKGKEKENIRSAFRMDVPPMTMKENLYASSFKLGSAHSRAHQESDDPEDITSATNKGAFVCGPSFSAIIQTEVMVGVAMFHLIQLGWEKIHHLGQHATVFHPVTTLLWLSQGLVLRVLLRIC